jgi:hypothetical protein
LTALQEAVDTWAEREAARIRADASFLTSLLSGRTNGGQIGDYVTSQVSALVEEEIQAFLAGGE